VKLIAIERLMVRISKIHKRVDLTSNHFFVMKKYQKAEIIAKNLPSGSYAAGCPAKDHHNGANGYERLCKNCDRAV
jgi:hypothetical protein